MKSEICRNQVFKWGLDEATIWLEARDATKLKG